MTKFMNSRYDTYGFTTAMLEEIASYLQQILNLLLEERDSSYYAGTYYLYKQAYGKELRVYNNHDPIQDLYVREQYRDYPVILQINNLDNMDEIQQKLMAGLKGIALLHSRIA